MSARRKRVISTEEIQFNHNIIDRKKKGVSQNGQTPSIIGICSYCVLDRPVFERCQTLLHPELTPWWSFLLADGAHHKKPYSPTHHNLRWWSNQWFQPIRIFDTYIYSAKCNGNVISVSGSKISPHYISITFAPLHFKCNYICHNLSGFTAWS